MAKKTMMMWGRNVYFIGLAIVFLTHGYMAVQAFIGNASMIGSEYIIHMMLNIVAVILIALGWSIQNDA